MIGDLDCGNLPTLHDGPRLRADAAAATEFDLWGDEISGPAVGNRERLDLDWCDCGGSGCAAAGSSDGNGRSGCETAARIGENQPQNMPADNLRNRGCATAATA